MKIIHFITDEKFLNDTIYLFEDIDFVENRYCVITESNTPFRYLKYDIVERVLPSKVEDLISSLNCDAVILHNLSSLSWKFYNKINKRIKLIWFSWGFDIYSNKYPEKPLVKIPNLVLANYLDKSNRLYELRDRLRERRKQVKDIICFKWNRLSYKPFENALSRIDYFAGVYDEEYELIKRNHFINAKPFKFNYPNTPDRYRAEDVNEFTEQREGTIQIGNCASILGNHAYAFSCLNNLKLGNRKILVPLSYAGTTAYINYVRNLGEKLFSSSFNPLINFIPYEEYVKLTSSVSVAIYCIYRQAAVGNIIMNLWDGVKVFMPEDSMNYKHFKSLGCKVYSVEKDLNQFEIDTPLSREEILNNRRVVSRLSYPCIKDNLIDSMRVL